MYLGTWKEKGGGGEAKDTVPAFIASVSNTKLKI